MSPGCIFYRPRVELSARMVLVCFDGRRALDASMMYKAETDLDEDFLEHHCHPLYHAIQVWAQTIPGFSFTSSQVSLGQVWGHTSEQSVAASTL